MKPKLIVNVGGMFSGKSSELQRQGKRHMLRGHKVLYLKPSTDVRYSNDSIVTHNGESVDAIPVDVKGLFNVWDSYDVILIDEVQFFDEGLITTINELLERGFRVYCSGLDLDFAGKPFGITPQLMAMADQVNKLHAVCDGCGEDAYISVRRGKSTELVELGHKDNYFPLCRSCHNKHLEKSRF